MDEEPEMDAPPERSGPNWGLIFAVGVFVFVIAGLVYLALPDQDPPDAGPERETYGPWVFEWEPPFWKTLYQRDGQVFDIRFRYLPQEVDTITVQGTTARLVSPFYLSLDPDMSADSKSYVGVAFTDATAKLRGIYGETPIAACISNDSDPACLSVPVANCDTPNASAIIFTEDAEPSVTLNGTCIIIRGTGPDLYRSSTLMWYRLLGIVQ